jgi:triacylglycerol lipase
VDPPKYGGEVCGRKESGVPNVSRRALIPVGLLVTAALVAGLTTLFSTTSTHRPFVGARQDRPGPVVLVPGYGGNTGSLERLAVHIRATGRVAEVFQLPGDGHGDLREQAKLLNGFVRKVRGSAPSIDVIGYSAGGIAVRLWLRDYGGLAITRRVVTIGSPHHGTQIAGLAAAFASGDCPAACQQLAPDADLLKELDAGDETPDGPQWTAMWTDADTVVTPADSGRLDGAMNVRLQAVCADEKVTHSGLPDAPLVIGIVLEAIRVQPMQVPTSRECSALRNLGGVRG